MVVPRRIPSFFKLFGPDFYSQRLRIPSTFISEMKGKLLNGTAYLRDNFGNVWDVEIISKREKMYFGNGWEKFVEDMEVVQGDILLFEFKGNSCFHFRHYGQDGGEKLEDFGSFQVSIISSDKEEEMDEEEEYEEEEDDDDDDDEVEEEEWARKRNGTVSKGKVVIKSEVGSEENGNKPDGRDVNIFESGLIARPRNAYFIAHLKKNKREGLFIKSKVIKLYNLKLQSEIIIVGEDGKEHYSPIKTWTDGRKMLTSGWRSFKRASAIKDDDTCLCEFLSTQTLFVRVLKYQAGRWMPRPRTGGSNTKFMV